ncbi:MULTISPECIES: NUDIX domain-containing protein [unclassified Streptomyces]|uniref:NUDIX domain-containing protein n=1 Tax=unclassified Streptomyces TaxID=2593676 RepID=UPI000C27E6A4|nr:NUDIX hydrolase [Streptomyces sp. CB02959]PJN37901.1 NUDIX hydrolase [Streptomyces sp. CB02959]
MTTTDDDYATYIAGLPRVLAGAAAIFRDAEGRLLLVEPNYRDTWVLPGGTIESDTGESPRQAARRETIEEIGLDVELGPLLAVDWVHGKARPPLVSYLFDGGVLDAARFAAIRLQEEELLSWRLVHWDEAETLMAEDLRLRVRGALDALERGRGPVELEDGLPPA